MKLFKKLKKVAKFDKATKKLAILTKAYSRHNNILSMCRAGGV